MDQCEALKKSGKPCIRAAEHTYEGHNICKKHWKILPKKVRKECRRRIKAMQEFTPILNHVIKQVIKHKRMSYRRMAELVQEAAAVTGTLNKKEQNDMIRLVITSVKLRRGIPPEKESATLMVIGELIKDICDSP